MGVSPYQHLTDDTDHHFNTQMGMRARELEEITKDCHFLFAFCESKSHDKDKMMEWEGTLMLSDL